MIIKRFLRPITNLMYDAVIAGIAFYGAVILRYDFALPEVHQAQMMMLFAIPYAVLCMVAFYAFGLHRNMWRYTSARELMRLTASITLALMTTATIMFIFTRLQHFPRSALIITWLLHIALAAGPRVLMRLIHERPSWLKPNKQGNRVQNVLLVGITDGTDLFIRETTRQHPKQFCIRGILDDDPSKHGRMIHDVPVMGTLVSLPKVLDLMAKRNAAIDTIILTDPKQTKLNDFIKVATARGIAVKRIPSLHALEEGETLTNLRPVMVEDLLGRDTIQLDMASITQMVSGKNVVVTGAGGSIGSELCRQVAQRKPQTLVLIENSEHALYQIDMEMRKTFPELTVKPILLDVRVKDDLKETFKAFPTDIIFHAAAYKHVPIVEANPVAGIENNLFGTMSVADAAIENNVPKMVVISTDKAVNPTNVMGATKRAAEIYCQNKSARDGEGTQIITVRFGNVLGSTGSVIPLFTRQIQEGGPVTVTHKEATRYFMTIPEAVQLILQAASHGKGSEIFMLDMGEPVNIWHMAEEMVRLSGLTPHEDIEIKEVGLRPGEKLFEELWYDGESMKQTDMEKTFLVDAIKIDENTLINWIKNIKTACESEDGFAAVTALKQLVPEYKPASNSPYDTKEKSS